MRVFDAKGNPLRPGMAARDRHGIVYEIVSIESPSGRRKPVIVLNGRKRSAKAGDELEALTTAAPGGQA